MMVVSPKATRKKENMNDHGTPQPVAGVESGRRANRGITVCGVVGLILGITAVVLSFIPIINNAAAVLGFVGAVLALVAASTFGAYTVMGKRTIGRLGALAQTSVSFIIGAAVLLVTSGQIPALWLMPVFVLSSAIFTPILDALSMSTNYGLIFGAAQRVLGLFAEKPLVRDEGKRRLDMRGTAVEVRFEDVCFTYPAAKGGEPNPPVLNGLSFSFRTGETVALVGASGGGKSTAARLLQRFWDVDGGRISINGTDVRELTLENLRDIVTVVPQEVYLFNMSVAENLRLARLSATDAEIREAARRARAEEFIEKLPKGYDTVIGERGLRLSGGEKQRLSIAQAFLKNAPVLVLDEASANLDAENERLINHAVEHLKQGRATLVIAHRISTIRAADRIVMVENGRVAGEGTYAQLMEGCPEFRKLMGDEYAGTEN